MKIQPAFTPQRHKSNRANSMKISDSQKQEDLTGEKFLSDMQKYETLKVLRKREFEISKCMQKSVRNWDEKRSTMRRKTTTKSTSFT